MNFAGNEVILMEKGRFIVLEGVDGSGKSTQIAMVRDQLESMGHKVFCTSEPTSGDVGKEIRRALSGEISRTNTDLAVMFLADRIQHCREISTHLNAGEIVLCDRYYYSSFAYQGNEECLSWVLESNLQCPELIRPDICVFLDIDYAKCVDRITGSREKLDSFEQDFDYMMTIRDRYIRTMSWCRDRRNAKISIINADADIQTVFGRIMKAILSVPGIDVQSKP